MLLVNYPLWLQGLFTAAVTLGAGTSLFVFVLNRQLSYVEFLHRRVLLGGFFGTLACAAASGLAVSNQVLAGLWLRAYLLVPGGILLFLLIGEMRLVVQRWLYRASPPVVSGNFRFDGHKLVARTDNPTHGWAHPVTTTDLVVTRYDVEVQGLALPPGSTGETVKVVQLSDFHFSPRLPFAYFRGAVEQAIREQADLVLLTGDFVTFQEDAARLPELFDGLGGRLGIFATLGNHDYWAGSQPVVQSLRQACVHLIANDCVRMPLWQDLSLRLCGCDDPWGRPAWQPPVFQEGDLNLIISHSSDNIYMLRRYPFAGVFSGHFHAGQVRLPGFGSIVLPSRYGRRFDHGHYRFRQDPRPGRLGLAETHLFVSAGVGSATPLLRIYCQPDIFVVNFNIVPQRSRVG